MCECVEIKININWTQQMWSKSVEWQLLALFFRSKEEEIRKLPRRIFGTRKKKKSDESKRPGHSINSSDLLGFEVSFRKLDVD
jgi:hypothetical protein